MKPHVIVIGAGVIGAAVAHRLAAHAQVTVISGHAPRATDASFGWINASFFADAAHYRLRAAGVAAYERLCNDAQVPVLPVASLCWETAGDEFDKQFNELASLGADVRFVDATEFRKLEPLVAQVPDRALLFQQEAVASSEALADALLRQAQAQGARLVTGIAVNALVTKGSRIVGIQTDVGEMFADQVLVAAGTGTERLMEGAGVILPMLKRPGLMMRTRPVAPMLSHVLASATQEVRQMEDGSLMAPVAASHQSDQSSEVNTPPDVLADQTIARLRKMFPGIKLDWDQVMMADRPMPSDGLPVVGAAGPDGLYVATMHSGITLAALMGELVATEMLQGVSNETSDLLAPYRPQRFAV